ncbi:unnamed protein product [Agarophyton chilense]
MVRKSVLICLLGLLSVCHGEGTGLNQNFSGVYKYASMKDILKILPEDPFFLSLVCPDTLIVNVSNSQAEANITLVTEEKESSRCFFSSNESLVSAEVNFQTLSLESPPVINSEGGKVSLLDLTKHFPLAGGNVRNARLVCPLLNRSVSDAQIVAQDMGFFYSILNHYQSSGQELGTAFSEIESSSVAPVEHSFSLNVALDSTDGIGCSYLKQEDEDKLLMEVGRLTGGGSSPTPEAEVSAFETPKATEASDEKACFPAAAQVKLADGSLRRMSALKEGDEIMDGNGSVSKIVMFTHSDAKAWWEFVELRTRTGSIVATRSHYIYVNGTLRTAGGVKVGDILSVLANDGGGALSGEAVLSKSTVRQRGLYNPQTASGSLLVFWDAHGVRCSAYTASVAPRVAHALLAPLRWLAATAAHQLLRLSSLCFTSFSL